MKKRVFEGYGCEIVERSGEYFIRYDSGESSGSKILEKPISFADIQKVMLSEKDAYQVILRISEHD